MGWTQMHRTRGQSDREFWQGQLGPKSRILDCATPGGSFGGTFYAAVETTHDDGSTEVWALVCLTQWVPNAVYNYGYKDMDERMGPNESQCPPRVLDLLSPLPECAHAEDYCALCGSRIWEFGGRWVSVARAGQVAGAGGPRCYSGFSVPRGWKQGDPPPLHQPGGTASCCTCWARSWRERCRSAAGNRARAAKVKPGQVIKFALPIAFASGASLDTLTFDKRDTFRADGCRYRIRGWRELSGWELVTS